MCMLCNLPGSGITSGTDPIRPAAGESKTEATERIADNGDGTYTFTLTKDELINMTMRLVAGKAVLG